MSPSPPNANEAVTRRFWTSTAITSLLGFSVSKPNLVLFILGWPASEFAQIWLLAQTLHLATLFKNHSDVVYQSSLVKIGLVLNFLAMRAGAENLQRGLKSRADFAKALTKANIEPKSGRTFASTLPGALLSLVPLFAVSRRGKPVKIERHIPYADIEKFAPHLVERWKKTPAIVRSAINIGRGRYSQWMTLDVFHLEGSEKNARGAPVLASFHGGAWALADKWISAHALFNRIASRGVIVAIINYRMSPEATWPEHIQDCKRGLIYVKKHCAEWGGDPNNVFLTGESAGAHLCTLAALTPHVPEFQPPEDMEGDTTVRGVLPLYGIFDFTNSSGNGEILLLFASRVVFQRGISYEGLADEFSKASPLYHLRKLINDPNPEVGKEVPPFFSVHGTKDVLAPYPDFRIFASEIQKLREKTGEVAKGDVFTTLGGAHHAVGFFPSPRNDALGDAMCDFIFHHAKHTAKL